jgi:hypothetical protein
MTTTRDIAPWPAPTTPPYAAEQGVTPRRDAVDDRLGLGLAGAVMGVMCFGLLALFSSNSCGMFADGCDTYGQTGPGFEAFLLGTLVSLGAVLACFVGLINRAARRSRISRR